MTVLALDTASRHRALCVLAGDDGALLDQRPLSGRDLDRQLAPALQALLGAAPDAVACVMGPGSYTGLRVGIAAALGVAHARGLPLYGIAALDIVALAAPADAAEVEAVADAGRGALYVARYRRAAAVEEAHRVEAGEWRPPAAGFVAVSLDGIEGTLDASAGAAAALALAAARALATPPLPLAGLEPVYLSSTAGHARQPRV